MRRYFQSWQEPADWEEFRSCLGDDVVFDPGGASIQGADQLTEMLRASESPWREVELLASLFGDDSAALFYEGTERSSGIRHRVAEYLDIEQGRIQRALVTIVQLTEPQGGT